VLVNVDCSREMKEAAGFYCRSRAALYFSAAAGLPALVTGPECLRSSSVTAPGGTCLAGQL